MYVATWRNVWHWGWYWLHALDFNVFYKTQHYTEVLDRYTAQQFNQFIDNQQQYKIKIMLYLYTWLHHTIITTLNTIY